jgi:TetR/AcrR family transcriptional repressor of bet genes
MQRRPGQERRSDLINATILEIGAAKSLDVTTSQIAKRAGVSSGLAFHYFKDKDSLFLAAMREVLSSFSRDVSVVGKTAKTPQDRLNAIAVACFGASSLDRNTMSAWIVFYALALKSDRARRLLSVYQRRLHSNLVYNLRPLIGEQAEASARRIAGLIDGLYLRYALEDRKYHALDGASEVMHAIKIECLEHSELHRSRSGAHPSSPEID